MIKTILLICSLHTSVGDCQRQTALAVIPLPPDANNSLFLCMFRGMTATAEANAVGPERYIKVVCEDITRIIE